VFFLTKVGGKTQFFKLVYKKKTGLNYRKTFVKGYGERILMLFLLVSTMLNEVFKFKSLFCPFAKNAPSWALLVKQ